MSGWLQAQQAEQERQKLLALQAAKYAHYQAAQEADNLSAELSAQPGPLIQPEPAAALADSTVNPAPVAAAPPSDVNAATSSGRKRRRTAVDYIALNQQMEAEAAGQAASLSFATAVPSTAMGVHASAQVPNERPDSLMDDTALVAEKAVKSPQQPHEGDRTL